MLRGYTHTLFLYTPCAAIQAYPHGECWYNSVELLCATGVLLQLADASRSCATCRQSLGSTDLESYPRNYALEAVLDERDRRFADTTGSELDPSTLRLNEEVLGEGGTGVVKAGELQLGAVNIQLSLLATAVRLLVKFLTCYCVQVAVKMLATHGADAAALQRFKQEIQGTINAARTCSLVCRVLGYCIKEQRLCLVMLRYTGSLITLVSGTTAFVSAAILQRTAECTCLMVLLTQCLPLLVEVTQIEFSCLLWWPGQGFSQDKAFRAALQLAKGIQQLHDVRILHLDIKPQNVLVNHHGDVAVSDFGISQQMQHTLSHFKPSTSVGMLGLPNYM